MIEFTGDRKVLDRCRLYLQGMGYCVKSALHVGGDVYELTEDRNLSELVKSNVNHIILAWVNEATGRVEFKKKVHNVVNIWF